VYLDFKKRTENGLLVIVDVCQRTTEMKLSFFCRTRVQNEQQKTDKDSCAIGVTKGPNEPKRASREWADDVQKRCNVDIYSNYRAAQDTEFWVSNCGSRSGRRWAVANGLPEPDITLISMAPE